MKLNYCPDTSAADWLVHSGTPGEQLITFGPSGFEAFARLRFIPDPAGPDREEANADIAEGRLSDIEQTRRALRLLATFTSTPQECYFCLWEGYSDAPLPPQAQRGPLVELPHRRYVLLRGALNDIDTWEADLGGGQSVAPPAFVWPADHRWCLASDVDPHWAGIGAEHAAIEALLGDPQLDVVPATPTDRQPQYY